MAKRVTEVDEQTGRVASKKMRRVREVDWPVTTVTSRRQRAWRNLVG